MPYFGMRDRLDKVRVETNTSYVFLHKLKKRTHLIADGGRADLDEGEVARRLTPFPVGVQEDVVLVRQLRQVDDVGRLNRAK